MPYGVLIVTGGMSHQENYAAGFQQDPRCKVIAVTDEASVDERRARLNQALADQLKVPHVRDLREALALPGVDLASICTEHHRQGRVAIQCAEAGKHLYIDKPMAGNLEEARKLAAIVRAKKLRTQMFTQVLLPYAQRVRRILRRGQVGELRAIHCDLHFAKGFSDSPPLARRKETASPDMFLVPDAKREMFNIAVYSLAMIRWATGGRPFRTVYATTANYFFNENRQRDFEDFGALTLTLDGGVTATISSGRVGWRSHPGGGHIRTRIVGARGSAFVDGGAAHGEICADGQSYWRVPAKNPADPMAFWSSSDQRKTGGPEWFNAAVAPSDQSAFIDTLEQNRDAEVTVADALVVLEALFGAYRSAARGEVVRLA